MAFPCIECDGRGGFGNPGEKNPHVCDICHGTGQIEDSQIGASHLPEPGQSFVCSHGEGTDAAGNCRRGCGYNSDAEYTGTTYDGPLAAEQAPWGYWTVWQETDTYMAALDAVVPAPNIASIQSEGQLSFPQLQEYVQRFGAYITHLYEVYGMLEARSKAVDEVLKTGLVRAKANATQRIRAERIPAAAQSEGLKEQYAWEDPELGATLSAARRESIQMESLVIRVKRRIDAYEAAWKTASRLESAQLGEMELERSNRGGG